MKEFHERIHKYTILLLKNIIDMMQRTYNNNRPATLRSRWAAYSYRKPQAKLVEEKSRSVETVEKEPPFAIIRSG